MRKVGVFGYTRARTPFPLGVICGRDHCRVDVGRGRAHLPMRRGAALDDHPNPSNLISIHEMILQLRRVMSASELVSRLG